MLKLYHINGSTLSAINIPYDIADYSVKVSIPSNKPMLTGGADGVSVGEDTYGYLVMTNGTTDRLFSLKGTSIKEIPSTDWPKPNGRITHISGGGGGDTSDMYGGGYIIFYDSNKHYLYLLRTNKSDQSSFFYSTEYNGLWPGDQPKNAKQYLYYESLSANYNEIILSAGGGNPCSGMVYFPNKHFGPTDVGPGNQDLKNTMFRLVNGDAAWATPAYCTLNNLSAGGCLGDKPIGYWADKVTKDLYYYQSPNIDNDPSFYAKQVKRSNGTNVKADYVATGINNNRLSLEYLNSNPVPNQRTYTRYTPACYYIIGNEVRFCVYEDLNNNLIDEKILGLPNMKPSFLSGGGMYYDTTEPYNGTNAYPPFGYVAYPDGSLYYLCGTKPPIIMSVQGTIQALEGMGNNYAGYKHIDVNHGNIISDVNNNNVTVGGGFLLAVVGDPCLHPNTKVSVLNTDGTIKNIPISEIKSGDTVIKYDGTPLKVINNAQLHIKYNFIEIRPHTLGHNMPNESLLITDKHPILHQGKEVLPSKLMENYEGITNCVLSDPVHVYTLITEERTAVIMNGMYVYTWNLDDFKKKKFNCILH